MQVLRATSNLKRRDLFNKSLRVMSKFQGILRFLSFRFIRHIRVQQSLSKVYSFNSDCITSALELKKFNSARSIFYTIKFPFNSKIEIILFLISLDLQIKTANNFSKAFKFEVRHQNFENLEVLFFVGFFIFILTFDLWYPHVYISILHSTLIFPLNSLLDAYQKSN